MEERVFVVKSSDGALYGPFSSSEGAAQWAGDNEGLVGDWCVETLYRPHIDV